jgi:hypothetical protein
LIAVLGVISKMKLLPSLVITAAAVGRGIEALAAGR